MTPDDCKHDIMWFVGTNAAGYPVYECDQCGYTVSGSVANEHDAEGSDSSAGEMDWRGFED